MRTYLNADEREYHIFIFALYCALEQFEESNGLTAEERKLVKKIRKTTDEFNQSVFSRLGRGYVSKLENIQKLNNIKLVGKYAPSTQIITECQQEAFDKIVESAREYNCLLCEREDYKDCGLYNGFCAYNFDGSDSETECPFRAGG